MDLTWRVPGKKLDVAKLREAGAATADTYEGVSVEVEKEDNDCVSLFFSVPGEAGDASEVEISVYSLGSDGLVLSLEADAADNHATWEDASQIAEDLADNLGGEPLEI
jgi:hypothetical protein